MRGLPPEPKLILKLELPTPCIRTLEMAVHEPAPFDLGRAAYEAGHRVSKYLIPASPSERKFDLDISLRDIPNDRAEPIIQALIDAGMQPIMRADRCSPTGYPRPTLRPGVDC